MAFDTQVILDGPKHHVIVLRGLATTTTGETGVIKVDRSGLTGPDGVNVPNELVIEEISSSIQGFESVQLYWEEAGGDEVIAQLSGDNFYDFRPDGGLHKPSASSAATDGDIKLSTYSVATEGAAIAGDTYFIKLTIRKNS